MAGAAEVLKAAREAKYTQWFDGRRWRICDEITGVRELDGVKIVYQSGEFWIEGDAKFHTPLGHPGKHGFLLTEVGPDGADIIGPMAAFGETALKTAQAKYACIVNLPEKRGTKPRDV